MIYSDLGGLEVIEFRKDSINLCKEIVETREVTKERHANYAYAAQVVKSLSPHQMFAGGMVLLSVWVNASHGSPVSVKVAVEANADTVIKETIESTYRRKKRHDRDVPLSTNFVLKICARQEYLLGPQSISQYKVRFICYFNLNYMNH